ncbi:2-phosphosulfolactate phosphatase [Aneurinibacillus sp. BA2021]|nr:2-phosphosulfolactate phosphatase [Aneurinibacillus sp. BA2021]
MKRKIHVLTCKEEVRSERLTQCTAVVIDVLLATTTMALALHHGATEIIPVAGEKEARQLHAELADASALLCGERGGYTIDGFHNPASLLSLDLAGRRLILVTTNGTVALQACRTARQLYAASLVNGAAVASQIYNDTTEGSIVIVCSGSDGRFALEDFLGAGHLISHLLSHTEQEWQLSDAAVAALKLYANEGAGQMAALLQRTETAQLLYALGYPEAIAYAARTDSIAVVPCWIEGRISSVQQAYPHA